MQNARNYIILIVFLVLTSILPPPTTATTTIDYDLADVTEAWAQWQADYVTADGAGEPPRMRVLGGVSDTTTVSEGQAYGILLAAIMDDQTLLDGLWLFAENHLTANGLMHWHVTSWGRVIGTGAATDADVDMAMGMIIACQKVTNEAWEASTHDLDYCTIATDLVNAIFDHEVDHPGVGPSTGLDDNPGYELIPGDSWYLKGDYRDGIVNLSYFAPGYFRVFAAFTGDDQWLDVIERNYAIGNASQALPGNCSGLVPNWSKYNGEPQLVPWQPEQYEDWSYDAVRFAWRVAVDAYWYDDAEANQTLNEIGGFFASVGMQNVRAEYNLDGTAVNNYANPLFISGAAVAIWGADAPIATDCGDATGSIQSTAQDAYDTLVAQSSENYFNDSWRLLTLVLMTEQFTNPLE